MLQRNKNYNHLISKDLIDKPTIEVLGRISIFSIELAPKNENAATRNSEVEIMNKEQIRLQKKLSKADQPTASYFFIEKSKAFYAALITQHSMLVDF